MEREYIRRRSGALGTSGSPWLDAEVPERPSLQGDVRTDVVIVGAGLVGALVANELTGRGLNVVVLERRRVACGTSGHSTAKITALHGDQWSSAVRMRGAGDAMRLWASLNAGAAEVIGRLVDERRIACNFRAVDGYLCERLDQRGDGLAREWQALRRLDLAVDDAEGIADSPFGKVVALRMDAQAIFDPAAFVLGLLASLPADQIDVYERSPVRALERQGSAWVARTDSGSVRAPVAVMTSLAPARDPALLFARAFPYAHYALQVEPPEVPRDGVWIQPGGSELTARPAAQAAGSWIVSGKDARLASRSDEQPLFAQLADDASSELAAVTMERFWSAEDFITPDRLPYVGRVGLRGNLYFVGGFGGWGMTKSVVAASLVADEIEGVAWQPLASLLSPNRFPGLAAWPDAVRENLYPLRRLIFPGSPQKHGVAPLPPVVPSVGDEPPRCTHLGCRTKVNTAEYTLDCPCHGSRYAYDGSPVFGPARRNVRLGASLSGDA